MSYDDWYIGGQFEAANEEDWVDDQQEVELSFDILVHTTEKAYLLQIGEENIWFPKSHSTLNMSMNNNTVRVPKWLADEKDLGEYHTDEPEDTTEVEGLFDKVMRKNVKEIEDDVPLKQHKGENKKKTR